MLLSLVTFAVEKIRRAKLANESLLKNFTTNVTGHPARTALHAG